MLHHMNRAVGGIPKLEFGAGSVDSVDRTTYTFSSIAIGTASITRRVVVCVRPRITGWVAGGGSDPTVTVGGVGCTLLTSNTNGLATNIGAWLFITNNVVPTGTTANVVVTTPDSRTMTACFIATYALSKNNPTIKQLEINVPSNAITSNLNSSQVGIFFGSGATSSVITGMSLSGPATQNYYSGIIESGGLLAATITGSGSCQITTTGTGSAARCILATWG